MDSLLNWVKGLIGCLLVMSLILQCVPGKIYRSYLRLFMGIILILTVLAPLSELTGLESKLESFMDKLAYEEVVPDWKDGSIIEQNWEEKLLMGEQWARNQIMMKAEEMSQEAENDQNDRRLETDTDEKDELREKEKSAHMETEENIRVEEISVEQIPVVKVSGGE